MNEHLGCDYKQHRDEPLYVTLKHKGELFNQSTCTYIEASKHVCLYRLGKDITSDPPPANSTGIRTSSTHGSTKKVYF